MGASNSIMKSNRAITGSPSNLNEEIDFNIRENVDLTKGKKPKRKVTQGKSQKSHGTIDYSNLGFSVLPNLTPSIERNKIDKSRYKCKGGYFINDSSKITSKKQNPAECIDSNNASNQQLNINDDSTGNKKPLKEELFLSLNYDNFLMSDDLLTQPRINMSYSFCNKNSGCINSDCTLNSERSTGLGTSSTKGRNKKNTEINKASAYVNYENKSNKLVIADSEENIFLIQNEKLDRDNAVSNKKNDINQNSTNKVYSSSKSTGNNVKAAKFLNRQQAQINTQNHMVFLEDDILPMFISFFSGTDILNCMNVCSYWMKCIQNFFDDTCEPISEKFRRKYSDYLNFESAIVKLQPTNTVVQSIRIDWVISAQVSDKCKNCTCSFGYIFSYLDESDKQKFFKNRHGIIQKKKKVIGHLPCEELGSHENQRFSRNNQSIQSSTIPSVKDFSGYNERHGCGQNILSHKSHNRLDFSDFKQNLGNPGITYGETVCSDLNSNSDIIDQLTSDSASSQKICNLDELGGFYDTKFSMDVLPKGKSRNLIICRDMSHFNGGEIQIANTNSIACVCVGDKIEFSINIFNPHGGYVDFSKIFFLDFMISYSNSSITQYLELYNRVSNNHYRRENDAIFNEFIENCKTDDFPINNLKDEKRLSLFQNLFALIGFEKNKKTQEIEGKKTSSDHISNQYNYNTLLLLDRRPIISGSNVYGQHSVFPDVSSLFSHDSSSTTQWYDIDKFQRMTTEKLKLPDQLLPQLHHVKTEFTGIDIAIRRTEYLAINFGKLDESIAKSNFGFSVEIVPKNMPIRHSMKRIGMQHDRLDDTLQLRIGDSIIYYLCQGGPRGN